MIKMSVFNKTNDALIVDTFKNVFQRRSSEVFKPDVPEFGTVQKYMLHCQYSVTFCTCWLVLSRKEVREVSLDMVLTFEICDEGSNAPSIGSLAVEQERMRWFSVPSALAFCQCFDIVGWVTGRTSDP